LNNPNGNSGYLQDFVEQVQLSFGFSVTPYRSGPVISDRLAILDDRIELESVQAGLPMDFHDAM